MAYTHSNRLLVFCLSLLIGVISTQCHCGNLFTSSADSGQDTAPQYTDPLAQAANDAGYSLLADRLEEIAQGNLQDINQTRGLNQTALHQAAEFGNITIIQKLLDGGANGNVEDIFKQTPLYYTISKGHTAATKLLLNQKSIHVTANDLVIATQKEDIEIVELLLAKNPTLIKSIYEKQDTILHLAAKSGKTAIIKLLLQKDRTLLNQPNKNKETPLLTAIIEGQAGAAKLLIEQGADIYNKYSSLGTPLDYAIHYGKADMVQLLLQKDPNLVRKKDSWGEQPIHKAAYEGQVDIFQLLLDHGADGSAKTSLGYSPLHEAVKEYSKANIVMMQKLLSNPTTDINAQDINGRSPLHLAIEYQKNADIIQLLLEKGAKMDKKDCWVLNSVIKKGRSDVLKLLLDHGFPIDIQTPETNELWSWALEEGNKAIMQLLRPVDPTFTDLHFAARQGDVETAKQLLQTNPSLKNAQDESGNTPLHIAARNGHTAFVKLLLEQGVDTSIANIKKEIAYHLAGYKGQQGEGVRKLLEAQDTSDKSLHNAVKEKNKEKVKALIEKEPGLMHAKNLWGTTPFQQAIPIGDIDIIELFLNKDPKLIEATNRNQQTPLHVAAYKGDTDVVKYLLTKKPNINAKDIYGNTPLLTASRGHIDEKTKNIFELLAKNNADVNAQNDKHETPLSIAIKKEWVDTVDLLLEKGANVNLQAKALISPDFSVKPPLSLAILQGNMPIIQLLLAKYPDIDAKNAAHRTPLCEAVFKHNKQVVEILFRRPTKPAVNILFKDWFTTTNHLVTPLYLAARAGDKEMVELLIDNGANVNQGGDGHEALPLHTAIKYQHSIWSNSGQHKATIALLLQRQATVSLQDDLGNTPMHIAASIGDIQTAELLFVKGPGTINMRNNLGNTPLHEAAINEQIEMIKWLLSKGADKNIRNVAGKLPANLATINEVVDLLK